MAGNKRKRVLETIKTLLCAVFFIVMIVLASAYIINTQRQNITPTDRIPINTLQVLKSGGSAATDAVYSREHLLPSFLGYNFGGGTGRGIMVNSDVMGDAYASVSDYLAYMFSSASNCIVQSGSEGNVLWNSCINGSSYVYIRYHYEIPYTLLYAFLSGETAVDSTKTASGEIVYVRELFLKPISSRENVYEMAAVTRDDKGTVALFYYNIESERERVSLDVSGLTAYENNSSFVDFTFTALYDGSFGNLLQQDSHPVLLDEIASRKIDAYISLADITGMESRDTTDDILSLFQYNVEKLNSYSEADGSAVFVENHGVMRFTADQNIYYSASSAKTGMDLSEFLGYGSYSGEYSLYEIVRMTESIIASCRRIDKDIIGGEADVVLSRVYYEEESIIVEYSYVYDNITVTENGKPIAACRFVVKGNMLVSMHIRSLSIYGDITWTMNYPQIWMAKNIGSALPEAVEGELQLRYEIMNSSDGVYSEWTALTAVDAAAAEDDGEEMETNELE